MESSRLKNMENRVMTEMADDAKIIETVVRAHFDTCDYTAEKIKPFIAKAQSEKQFTQCTGMSLVCLNGDVIKRETISAMPAG